MILLALVGPDYEVLYANVGCNGRASDGTVWNDSGLKSLFASADNPLNMPSCGREVSIPHVVTGDDAFCLQPELMKPYPLLGSPRNNGFSIIDCLCSEEC